MRDGQPCGCGAATYDGGEPGDGRVALAAGPAQADVRLSRVHLPVLFFRKHDGYVQTGMLVVSAYNLQSHPAMIVPKGARSPRRCALSASCVLASRPSAAFRAHLAKSDCGVRLDLSCLETILVNLATSFACLCLSASRTLMFSTEGASGLRGQPGNDGSLPSYAAHEGP